LLLLYYYYIIIFFKWAWAGVALATAGPGQVCPWLKS
jgi:hypothetical protein